MAFLEVHEGDDDPIPPPEGLQAAGTAMWEAITAEWELDAAALITLESACRSRDLEARCQADVDKAGRLRVKGSRDNWVSIPEADLLVKVRSQTAQLLSKLNLESDVADDGDLFGDDAASAKARRAAKARWDRRFDLA